MARHSNGSSNSGSNSQNSNQSNRGDQIDQCNFIKTWLVKHFDSENYTRFQHILEHLGESVHKQIYQKCNDNLFTQIGIDHARYHDPKSEISPDDIDFDSLIRLKFSFHTLRYIGEVGRLLVSEIETGNDKSNYYFVKLMKVLLYHGLTAKNDTASLALVQFEQLCYQRNITPSSLYHSCRSKFLRLIIKAILLKLMTNGEMVEPANSVNGNNSSDGNSSIWSTSSRSNCVTTYMTRALEVFDIGATIRSDDITQSMIIITNLLHQEKFHNPIKVFLDCLASYQEIDILTLIRSHIHSVIVSLLLKRKLSNFDITLLLNKLCSLCDTTPRNLLATKFTSIKAGLLLHYSTDPKVVKDGIYYMSKFEKDESEQPFEDEFDDMKHFIDYLNPSLIGILYEMDAQFKAIAKDLVSEGGIKQIRSLHSLLSSLNANQVQVIHVKLLSTLSLLLRLRPTRDNYDLNMALRDLWKEFVAKLSKELRNSLVIIICTTLYDLMEDCPQDISSIYADLICKDDSFKLVSQLHSLFFIPNLPGMEDIYSYLTPHVKREIKVIDSQDFAKKLTALLPLLKLENHKCRIIALTRIRQLLHINQQLLISAMSINPDEPLDSYLSQTIETLISLSHIQDEECSPLIAESLGILGAINPTRMDHLIYGGLSSETKVLSLLDSKFLVLLTDLLARSLFSDQVSESETANYALQVVVKRYSIFDKSAKVRDQLSEEALRACQLCQNTNYVGMKKGPLEMTCSVFEKMKSEHQYSYKDWLDKFATALIHPMKEPAIQDALSACSYVFRYNQKLAEFILPHAILHIILHQPTQTYVVKREFKAILDEDFSYSTQDMDDLRPDNEKSEMKELVVKCATIIFCTMDAADRLDCEIRRYKTNHLGQKQVESLREFIKDIGRDFLGRLAIVANSLPRGLCYYEQYVIKNPEHRKDFLTKIQKLLVRLGDFYEAAGADSIRTSSTSMFDDRVNYEAYRMYDKAYVMCLSDLETDQKSDIHNNVNSVLYFLSKMSDHQRLYDKSKMLLIEFPQYKRTILPYAVEATWKLGKWDELSQTVKSAQVEDRMDLGVVNLGYLLMSTVESKKSLAENLKQVRQRAMKPLSNALMDRSVYFRGYRNLLELHNLGDFGLASDILNKSSEQQVDENTVDVLREQLSGMLNELFDIWNKRNKLVQPTLETLEPLLCWQRSVSQVILKKIPFMKHKIEIEIAKMWLRSADVARDNRTFDRSFFCLTQARKWFGNEFVKLDLDVKVEYHIAHAKLDWEQKEQTKAIRGLKTILEKLKDHRLSQHLQLRLNRTSVSDPFPHLNTLSTCEKCERIDMVERKSFAELKMLLTRYSEEAAASLPETLFFMYEECVHLGVNQEETYFCLARYYDKLLEYYMENPKLCGEQSTEHNHDATQRFSQSIMSGDREEVYTKLMEHSIMAFGNSLKYGVRYLRESMPRLLNIWYDLGSKKPRAGSGSTPRSVHSRIENTIRFIDGLKKKVPPYYFMTAISLLLSRVSHPHTGISKKTCELVELLIANFPHQISWLLIAVLNDKENDDRRKAAKLIVNSAKKKGTNIDKIVQETILFSKILIEIAYNHSPADRKIPDSKKKQLRGLVNLKDISPAAAKFDFNNLKVLAPVEASIRPVIPIDNLGTENYTVFPERNLLYIRSLGNQVRVYNSLQQPRALVLNCDNGRSLSILCKAGDDLRKDSRCCEFLNLLDRILRRDSQANERFIEMQTYLVLPLECDSGIIEMVPNVESLRSIIEPLYKERRPEFSVSEFAPKRQRTMQPTELYELYTNSILPSVSPPVLNTWFFRKFPEPTSWYMARLAFTRTSAVISMGGYIIGLGDRHLDNILLDNRNGRVVHVDFNLLFHQGETLLCPEVVPFRLTPNLISAFGTMGAEGNFRKVCEITMRVMRKEKDALLTTLKPFMHDPCSEWIKIRDRGGNRSEIEDKHENKSAKFRIEVTERKLKGFPRSKKFKPLMLMDSYSVEAQVDNLIEEAMDKRNLSQMYYGWCPHI